ncbi:MAG: hypothetical protein IJT45_06205 [Bacteroidales bacterium]|nr:hypothetical protein [Bacteroidales bacterium]
MKFENELNEEVRQLLECLEEHGQNARRQKELGELIDSFAKTEMSHKHRKLTPLWWAISTAAAVLLLWLLAKPKMDENLDFSDETIAEVVVTADSVTVDDTVFEEPIIIEYLLAEEKPIVHQKPQIKKAEPRIEIVEEVVEQPVIAEIIEIEPIDTVLDVQNPKRRVIRSLNLVCFECQKEPDENQLQIVISKTEKTIFGQPQDPNMKDGALAWQVKIN